MTTIDHQEGPVDPAAAMLRRALARVAPRSVDELLDLASLIGEIDGGHITAQTVAAR